MLLPALPLPNKDSKIETEGLVFDPQIHGQPVQIEAAFRPLVFPLIRRYYVVINRRPIVSKFRDRRFACTPWALRYFPA